MRIKKLNAEEKRNLVKEKIKSRKDKNIYDQSKREQVGSGFGDCSSTVQWAYKEAIGIDVGVNTVAQYCNVQGIDIDKNNGTYVDSEKGNPYPIEEKLKIADLLFFSGSSDSGRADNDYVAHVEMYIGDGTLIGHGGEKGSIGPTMKELVEYCNQKVKVGQRYLKTRRFIKDDETDSKGSNSNTSSTTKAETNTSSVVSKGASNNTITNKSNQTYLKKNCKGNEVGILQKNLTALGYNTKGIDNTFGTNTEKAVIAFQKANGLEPDGIVGPKTQAKINLLILKKVGKNLISYVIDGATLKCSAGTKTTNLLVPKSNLSSLQGKKQATIIDNSPNVNILPFGTCKKSNSPCSPKIKFNWINSKSNFVIGGSQVITKDSCLACLNGGVISIGNTGQSTVPKAKTSTTKSSVTSSQLLLKYGSKGINVEELQTNLKALGFDTKGIDGDFGKNTKIAVIEFQKAYGLKDDGIVGPETKKKIAELLAKKTSTSNKNEENEKKDAKENKSENSKETSNYRTVVLPDEVRGEVNGKSKVLYPNVKWGIIGKGSYPTGIQMTEDGRYKVAVAPRILNPNYSDEGKIWTSDFDGINRNIDVLLENKSTGKRITIECYICDIKAHSYNEYKDNDNNASFGIENGLIQTGIAYPNSWNAKHGIAFAPNNIDASVIEFTGHSTGDFNPNDYKLIEIHVYK